MAAVPGVAAGGGSGDTARAIAPTTSNKHAATTADRTNPRLPKDPAFPPPSRPARQSSRGRVRGQGKGLFGYLETNIAYDAV